MKTHITVLTEEAVNALAIKHNAVVVDATLGSAGHARQIVSKLDTGGVFVGIDADQSAIDAAQDISGHKGVKTHLCAGNFRNIDSILDALLIQEVDGILADLGWRMEQFSGNGRGFSFQVDEPLIMTFGDPAQYPFVAHDIVNEWKEQDIANVLRAYGEEKFSGRIARVIVETREKQPIMTTFELVAAIEAAVPAFYRKGKIHPATRTFQALRIAVNDEFDALETFIRASILRLKQGGRLAIISFHSLEDRIVKHSFRAYAQDGGGTIITKKPITATREELQINPRARSAKLRVFEKL